MYKYMFFNVFLLFHAELIRNLNHAAGLIDNDLE